MSGALVVEGLLDPFPALRGIRERVLLLKDIQLEDGTVANWSIGDHTIRTVNGLINPTLDLRPGETELWRIGNVGANLYYRLRLDGHQLYQVARDGNRLARVVPPDKILVHPADVSRCCSSLLGSGHTSFEPWRWIRDPKEINIPLPTSPRCR
jgi:suppressor of ftsI